MLKFLNNIKYLNKEKKKKIKFKINNKIINLANILLANNLIANFTIEVPYILVSLKINSILNKSMITSIKSYINSNKVVTISYKDLYSLSRKNPTSLYIVNTPVGIIDNQKALSLKIGGILLFKIN